MGLGIVSESLDIDRVVIKAGVFLVYMDGC